MSQMEFDKKINQTKGVATSIVNKIKCAVPLGDIIDVEKEKKRILGQIEQQKNASQGLANRLKNKAFLKKAPEEIVKKDKERLKSIQTNIGELEKVIADLK